ncbi:hypothetical protein CEXT_621761 [Caerostris extrusa]|uniref:Uncharacterized protein n=1 Tax=Caerostris extrusa TaxID=172846 RepID=A0AAV4NA22_CAEEX|nr:hypothetical protein CEXT_621761 [Caerostris extrusa]
MGGLDAAAAKCGELGITHISSSLNAEDIPHPTPHTHTQTRIPVFLYSCIFSGHIRIVCCCSSVVRTFLVEHRHHVTSSESHRFRIHYLMLRILRGNAGILGRNA